MTALSRRHLLEAGAAAGLALTARPALARTGIRPGPFLLGADISWIPEDQANGATYALEGQIADPLAIFAAMGFNAIKLRTFVQPALGYARGKQRAWCDLSETIAFGRRIRAQGLHFSTTLHYSDIWADPQHQEKPAAWRDLSFAALLTRVHDYSADCVAALVKGGAAPDLLVIGNETTFGMLWPDGRVSLPVPTGNAQIDAVHLHGGDAAGVDRFAALLKAAIAGARRAGPGEMKIGLHNHLGRHWDIVRHWTDALLARGVRFDALGLSCYQQVAQGDWARTFAAFAQRYPDIGFLALEYASRKRYLNDLVHAQPQGWGSFVWEPTRHQEAIFRQNGSLAGEGPRPDLLSQGLNSAEAPGAGTDAPAAAPTARDHGGRYDADPAFTALYRTLARDYGLAPKPLRRS